MKIISKNSSKKSLNNIKIGKNVKIYDYVNAYQCEIGDNSKIGAFVEIQKGSIIGKNCKVSSHSFICEGVEIEDNCFIGHGVMFTNDLFPRATNKDGSLDILNIWKVLQLTICKLLFQDIHKYKDS